MTPYRRTQSRTSSSDARKRSATEAGSSWSHTRRSAAILARSGRVDLLELAALLDAAPSSEAPGACGVDQDPVARRQHRGESLLALERLHRQADPEHRRRRVTAVLSATRPPAACHPVVPHERPT